jgi:hypothetical protein
MSSTAEDARAGCRRGVGLGEDLPAGPALFIRLT